MTRSKKTPSVHKPPFDEENTLRFAEMAPKSPSAAAERVKAACTSKQGETKSVKNPETERKSITLLLKAETITALQHEAGRKGKAVDQIIDKLVAKHLDRQK